MTETQSLQTTLMDASDLVLLTTISTSATHVLHHIRSSPILLGRIHLVAMHRALGPIRHLLPAMVPRNKFNPLFTRIMTACGWIIENPTTTTFYQNGEALTCINLTSSK